MRANQLKLWVGAKCAVLCLLIALPISAAEQLKVAVDKSQLIRLEGAASAVSVANPKVADVIVQSPTVILVTGKSIGETSVNIVYGRENALLNYDVSVTPDMQDQITINMGADAVKTLKCQPRCVRVGNPGRDPEPGKGSGGGGSKGGGLLSAVGGKKK